MLRYFDFGFIKLPAYGCMVFLGIAAFVAVSVFILRKIEKKDKDTVIRTLLVSGASLAVMYVSAALFDGIFHSIEEGRLVFGGITWEGGVVGGFTAFILLSHFFIKKERGSVIELFSAVMPGLVLAHAFGRVGCFFGGCCFGRITQGPFGVVFPDGSPAAKLYPNTITQVGSFPVVPTQLIEAVFEFLLFAVMIAFYKKLKGENLSIYLVFYGVFRFILEFWRGDDRGAVGFFLSPSQFMSIVLFVCGVLVFLFKRGVIFKNLAKKCENWRLYAENGIDSAALLDPIASLERLYRLKNVGAITDEEYERKKNELLDKIK